MLQSIVAPTVQPALGLIETKVIVAGSVSRRWTPLASEGPPFVTTIVYVTSLPAAAAEGPSLVTETSACVDGVDVPHDVELFSSRPSGFALETEAVLMNRLPLGVPIGM